MKYGKIIIVFMCLLFFSGRIDADGKENGYFGGVSEGENLPKSIEKTVNYTAKATDKVYKEVVFVSGKPIVMSGTIKITKGDTVIATKPSGTYNESYDIKLTNDVEKASLTRSLKLTVAYTVTDGQFKKQINRTVVNADWTESIKVGDAVLTLNKVGSKYSMSTIEEVTPGITYYTTTITSMGRYLDSDNKEYYIISEGQADGYYQPWSKVEKLVLDQEVQRPDGNNLSVTIDSKSTAFKSLYFDKSDPFPTSIEGTYNERLERESTISYSIKAGGKDLKPEVKNGTVSINMPNEIEKLAVPEGMDAFKTTWSLENFRRLYSLQVFSELPREGMEYEAMSRGDFVAALVKVLKIDTSAYAKIDPKKVKPLFEDVPITHPLFKYIQTAYDKKLIRGIGNRSFNIDEPITRQEAFVIYIRVIGLENIGVTDTISPFADDKQIEPWAKKEIIAGYKLGIIQGDKSNKVLPLQKLSKAEAAAIIDRLNIYLRQEMVDKFNE